MKRWMAAFPAVAALAVAGCGSGGGASIGTVHRSGTAPLRIVTTRNAAVALAPVSIDGQGPFQFIVDTGASQSVVDSAVARRLGLSTSGRQQVGGVGCQTTAGTASVSRWTVGGFRLPSDRVDVLNLAVGNHAGGTPTVDGLLGSDELSKFGAAAIDYQAGKLRLGPGAASLSRAGATKVPIRVVDGHGAVLAVAPVRIRGRGPYAFVVDSGATSSVVASTVAHRLGLPTESRGGRATGVACQTKTSVVKVRRWRVGSTRLPAQPVAEIKLPTQLQSAGVRGLLGSGTLYTFGTVAINYSAQRLVLSPRLATPRGGVTRLSVTHLHGNTIGVVEVKIDGRGPYRFALDTGASKSAVDSSIARRLNLPSTGQTATISGAVAARNVNLARVARWSVGGVALPRSAVAIVNLPHSTGPDAVQGLVGSDVLRQFAVVTIDYGDGQLELGQAASPPSSPHVVTLHEVNSNGATEVLAPVKLEGRGPFGFTLDTGAGHTLIARGLAQQLGLRLTGARAVVRGVVAGSTAAVVAINHWSVGSVALPPTDAMTLPQPSVSTPGLLGSDVLSHFGSVTVDYRADQLLLP